MGPIWQTQLGESLVMLIGPSWEPNLLPYWHQIWGPFGKQDVCPNGWVTLRQRQIRQSPGLTLNAHSGNDWGPIPVLTGAYMIQGYMYLSNEEKEEPHK